MATDNNTQALDVAKRLSIQLSKCNDTLDVKVMAIEALLASHKSQMQSQISAAILHNMANKS